MNSIHTKNIRLRFSVSAEEKQFSAMHDGKCVLEGTFQAGILTVAILYSCSNDRLCLRASAGPGDAATVCLYPHRIELYINGQLADEEWPWGHHFIREAELAQCSTEVEFSDTVYEKKEQPSVVGTFENAEGWRPGGGVYVGDCMPYTNDGRYHVLYLKDRHHHASKWWKGAHQWEHISTGDFHQWQIHPTAVEITRPEEGSICTGSWLKKGNRQYLYYTVRSCTPEIKAMIRRSVSDDGYHFEKDESFGFCLSDKYNVHSARDPKVVRDSGGLYHMILTTSLVSEGRGCLAHLVSTDLDHWEEMEEPLYIGPDGNEPECPDYFEFGGRYYLIFSHHAKGEYRWSDKPFSDWVRPKDPYIPCETVPKMAVFNDRIIFTGFKGHEGKYAGTMTFKEAVVQDNGELAYQEFHA